ncbi:MAG TPA: c-type cytochrome [Burkholderiales bacterium]
MKQKVLACAAALILPTFLFTETAGAAKSDSCAHCHGTDGNSTASAYPSLAGQTREYLYRQIKAFKEGQRKNSMMSPAVVVLSDQDMQDLAEYFSGQTLVRSTAKTDPAIVEQGKKIASETQCVACHQPNFKGLNEFPRVSRQKYPYIVKQLKDFREGIRVSDVMGPTVKNLTDEQIEALAQYLTSL